MDARAAIKAIIDNQPSWIVRAYSRVRFSILHQEILDQIGQYFGARARILDLGCGFGLFSLYYALTGPGRDIVGVDRNEARVEMANSCARALRVRSVRYVAKDALEFRGEEPFDAIYMLDLIHHLPRHEVRGFLAELRSLLRPGALLVIKDVANRPHYKRWFTLALDRAMVGFTEPIYYWPPDELVGLVQGLGFEVKRHPIKDILPYPHMLYVCTLQP
jgi:2-polyprenyl-3-methyl-5-hydroxy-6-metoxy-1,4-benzoquinol methylase